MALTLDNDAQCIAESEAWSILVDMLHALNHLSKLKLIHMDVKPDNIFVSYESPCVYKLGDFGLMISCDNTNNLDAQEGDSKFLALEVLSEVFTPAADVFSLGATLLDCVTLIEMPKYGKWWQLLRESLNNLPDSFSSRLYF